MRLAAEILLRPVLAAIGVLAIIWCALTLPIFWRSYAIEYVSSQILRGIPYTSSSLAEMLPAIDALKSEGADCAPRALHGAAIIQLHIMEEGFSSDQLPQLDQRTAAVTDAIRRSLACAPADPFLWMVLYSVESARNGFRQQYLDYIRESYRLGPREAWISVRRNRAVLAIYPMLPPDIAEMALAEFADLVQNRLYDKSADILLSAGWNIRDRLLSQLDTVGERERKAFAESLYAKGVNLDIPGIAPPGARPWR